MEVPSASWLSEMEMEYTTFIHQSNQLNSLDYSFDGLNFMSFFTENHSSHPVPSFTPKSPHNFSTSTTISMENPQMAIEIPAIQLKSNTTTWNSCLSITNHLSAKASPSSSSHLISLEYLNSPMVTSHEQDYGLSASVITKPRIEVGPNIGDMMFRPLMISQDSYDYEAQNILSPKYGQGAKRIRHASDHVIAERNRRKKLNQQFITLAAIAPGLKKMDKVTVLGHFIEYVKHLQRRLKTLEEEATKNKVVEPVVLLKRLWVCSIGDIPSSNENVDSCSDDQPLPEVEARTLDKDVLI
ncbi:hypothetical protein FNV43_RR17409 [Rhamnella rubrinervis]|uniref:BHLH domain-containing protein n=1 Tax=Rhamnella rubrinervis TaxID=2594499 RepID=A0A8K0GUT9_9ROSA|nr:hypothetical protein FNV43_RR17409 [Rhamnella rubrinervis]